MLAASTLAFAVVASAGRSCHGADGAFNSRYLPYMVPGMLAMYVSSVVVLGEGEAVAGRRRPARIRGARRVGAFGRLPRRAYYQAGKARWVRCFLSEHDVHACTETAAFGIYPDPRAPDLLDKLTIMERRLLGFFAGR